ncbi:hypothetical protein GCM10009577_47100 [Streptomyces javensis]
MISLLRSVYSATEAAPIRLLDRRRFPNADAIERHLLDGLVPAVFNGVPAPRRAYHRQLAAGRRTAPVAGWRT